MDALFWQGLQILSMLLYAPLLEGWIAWLVARLEGRQGVSPFQPYYDLYKLGHKELLLPGSAGIFYQLAPPLSLATMIAIATLIPILTTFPLPLGWMGDMVAGGMLFALSSTVITLAGLETGNSYGGIGAWRSGFLNVLVEPALILVLIAVALFAHATYPYVAGAAYRQSWISYLDPAHLLAVVAFFLIFLVDTGRLPIENHSGGAEVSMIEEARVLEYTGRDALLLRWSGMAKQFLLMVILLNVFVAPWGMANQFSLLGFLEALSSLLAKTLALGGLIALIEVSLARLRYYRYPEYFSLALLLAIVTIAAAQLGGLR
jgi:formate hydrogenlyase subunit 4